MEMDAGPVDIRMAIPQRRQAEGFVGLHIFFVAHSNTCLIQQARNRRDYFTLRQAAPRQILIHARANFRQSGAEGGHTVELRLVAHLAIVRMIAVLFAPPRIASNRLNMAVLEWANPYVLPSRRDHQRMNSLQRRLVANRFRVWSKVDETFPTALPGDTRLFAGHIAEMCGFRGRLRIRLGYRIVAGHHNHGGGERRECFAILCKLRSDLQPTALKHASSTFATSRPRATRFSVANSSWTTP